MNCNKKTLAALLKILGTLDQDNLISGGITSLEAALLRDFTVKAMSILNVRLKKGAVLRT